MLLFQEAKKTSHFWSNSPWEKSQKEGSGRVTTPGSPQRSTGAPSLMSNVMIDCFFLWVFFLATYFGGVAWWFASFSRAIWIDQMVKLGVQKSPINERNPSTGKRLGSLRYATVEEVSVPLAMEAYKWGWSAPSKQLVRHLKSRSRIERVVELPRP